VVLTFLMPVLAPEGSGQPAGPVIRLGWVEL